MHAIDGMAGAKRGCDNRGTLGLNIVGPDFVTNQPWPTMLRPGFPKLSHPGLPHALSSIAFIAPV